MNVHPGHLKYVHILLKYLTVVGYQMYTLKQRKSSIHWSLPRNYVHFSVTLTPGSNLPSLKLSQSLTKKYTFAFLLHSPPAKWLNCDVTMHAVHFWGRERGFYLCDESALPVTEKESMCEGKRSICPWMINGHANLSSFCAFKPFLKYSMYLMNIQSYCLIKNMKHGCLVQYRWMRMPWMSCMIWICNSYHK